jgi:adenine-specific DNA-methyltransferase
MPTLHWVGKDKVVNHHQEVPFKTLRHAYRFDAPDGTPANSTGNRIIHGDNLEALKALLPEYEGRIKCIYIDPPYNTGNEGWVYNDNVNDPKLKKWLGQVVGKEGEDLSRHDKWLCMMYPRLKLLHRLLAKDGAIFISIDDTEGASLKLLLDEIFGFGNFVVNLIWQKMDSPSSNAKNRPFSNYHDHTFVYARSLDNCKLSQLSKPEILNAYPEQNGHGERFRLRQLRKNGKSAKRSDRPSMWYKLEAPDGTEVWPIHPQEHWEGRWAVSPSTYEVLVSKDEIVWKKREHGWVPYSIEWAPKEPAIPNPSILTDVGQNRQAKAQLNEILGTDHGFDTPKPVGLVHRILQIASEKDSIILDSFAGSGTTAHAVLKLNQQDGGQRQFILIETMDYAETITAERVRRVMTGYGTGDKAVAGLGGGFDYYGMGEPLFRADGNLNEAVGTEEIRRYVAYTEGVPPAVRSAGNGKATGKLARYLLGMAGETAVIFYYEPDRVTKLDTKFLATLKDKPASAIIYADLCLLDTKFLKQHNLIFKKIPREIRKF